MAKKSPSKSFPKVELEHELWQQLKHKIYLKSGPQIRFQAHQCVALKKSHNLAFNLKLNA